MSKRQIMVGVVCIILIVLLSGCTNPSTTVKVFYSDEFMGYVNFDIEVKYNTSAIDFIRAEYIYQSRSDGLQVRYIIPIGQTTYRIITGSNYYTGSLSFPYGDRRPYFNEISFFFHGWDTIVISWDGV